MGQVTSTFKVGLVVTAALGLLMVGELNPISVAFAALFVGLGIDFGIQFAVRYRADRYEQPDIYSALRAAARGVGWSLTLAAISLLAGFFAFLPTAFRGVSELGQPPRLDPDEDVEALRDLLIDIVGEDADLVLGATVYGLTQREVGERLGLSHDATRKRFQRAIERIRQHFEAE